MNKPKNGKAGTYVADDSLYPLVFISCIIAPHNLPTICPANIPPSPPPFDYDCSLATRNLFAVARIVLVRCFSFLAANDIVIATSK